MREAVLDEGDKPKRSAAASIRTIREQVLLNDTMNGRMREGRNGREDLEDELQEALEGLIALIAQASSLDHKGASADGR